MHALSFWKDWPRNHRMLWLALAGVFIFSLLCLWFTWFEGVHGIIHWERVQEQRIIETPVHQFQLGPFQLSIPGESYVIFEYLQGSDIEHNQLASYIFLAVLMFSSMVILSVISTLKKFWYFLGMTLFMFFILGLRLDVLHLFGIGGYGVPIVVLLLYLSLSFYFKSFRSAAGMGTRLISFSASANLNSPFAIAAKSSSCSF